MDRPVVPPDAGEGGVGGAFTPAQAKKFFEFFDVGTHREVLLLSDLVEQPVHYVRSHGHKVLCGRRVGRCELCEQHAGKSADVGVMQLDFYAAAFVRPWREQEYVQRVAVFSQAAAEDILTKIPAGSLRGHRLDVTRYKHGSSKRFKIDTLDGLPRDFPSVMPAAFPVEAFVRARYGLRQDPHRPLVFLPPFKCERVKDGPTGRPQALGLTADDFAPASPEARAKLRAFAAGFDRPAPEAAPAAVPAAVVEPAFAGDEVGGPAAPAKAPTVTAAAIPATTAKTRHVLTVEQTDGGTTATVTSATVTNPTPTPINPDPARHVRENILSFANGTKLPANGKGGVR